MCVCVCVCVCACVRACVRACKRACVYSFTVASKDKILRFINILITIIITIRQERVCKLSLEPQTMPVDIARYHTVAVRVHVARDRRSSILLDILTALALLALRLSLHSA